MRRVSLLWVGSLAIGCSLSGCYSDYSPIDPDRPPTVEPPPPPTTSLPPVMPTVPLDPSLEGPSVSLESPPPPISGGTLAILGGRWTAVVSDPDRDRLVVADLADKRVLTDFALSPGDEPGRIAEDGAGRIHVVLRGSGELLTADPLDLAATATRRSVCPMPRGVAHDPATDLVHVVCRGGELVSLPATGGVPTLHVRVGDDLRDVVVDGDHLLVTRFRAAEVLTVSRAGAITSRLSLPSRTSFAPIDPSVSPDGMVEFSAAVAWRAVGLPDGGAAIIHQRASDGTIVIEPGGYAAGGECRTGIVESAISIVRGGSVISSGAIIGSTLPVDIAVSEDGQRLGVVSAGTLVPSFGPNALSVQREQVEREEPCVFPEGDGYLDEGQAIAAGYDGNDSLVALYRAPSLRLLTATGSIELGGEPRHDTGHQIFHMAAGGPMSTSFLACASCHPEGGDDGRVWHFSDFGARRTQAFEGGLTGSEPFHWGGDMPDLTVLLEQVLTGRMSGPLLRDDHVDALAHFLDSIPAPPARADVDPAAAARGDALFHSPGPACSTCHSGERLTNNETVDVGTGEPLQVPSLVGVSYRAPFLHDGCAPTLSDRFGECGGGTLHGNTASLSPSDVIDLVSYLETL